MPRTSPPEGYVVVRRGAVRLLLREEVRGILGRVDVTDVDALRGMAVEPGGDRGLHGRGRHFAVEIGDGVRAVVKESRRGGWWGRIFPDLYFGDARFDREIRVTCEAARRGIRVASILASVTRPAGVGFCRHHYLIREMEGAVDLRVSLMGNHRGTTEGFRRRRAIVRSVAEGVRALHDAGICHADLNLGNILIGGEAEGPVEVGFIDLDTTRLTGAAPSRRRVRNVLRLYRSAMKAGLAADALPRTDLVRFVLSYHGGDRQAARRAWRALRRGRLLLGLHRLLWRLGAR